MSRRPWPASPPPSSPTNSATSSPKAATPSSPTTSAPPPTPSTSSSTPAKLGPYEARYVEAAFRAHEVEAVQTAQPTTDAHDLIRAWKATGRQLAIVSNNSRNAVETYIDLHDLRDNIDYIAARTSVDTSHLKPSPHLVSQVVAALAARPDHCTLVGDSLSDIQAAKAANVLAIAYANRPDKVQRLATAEPEATVTTIALLISPVRASVDQAD